METKKINLEGLTNVLSPSEMKKVTGGAERMYPRCGPDEWVCYYADPFFCHIEFCETHYDKNDGYGPFICCYGGGAGDYCAYCFTW